MRIGHVHVDPEHLAEQLAAGLRAVAGIVCGAAVAQSDVQISIGAKGEVTAVVIRKRLVDPCRTGGSVPAQIKTRRHVGGQRIGRAAEARYHRVAGSIREVHEEAPTRVRHERQAEQPLLAA